MPTFEQTSLSPDSTSDFAQPQFINGKFSSIKEVVIIGLPDSSSGEIPAAVIVLQVLVVSRIFWLNLKGGCISGLILEKNFFSQI